MTITRWGIAGFHTVWRPTIRPSSSIRRAASLDTAGTPVEHDPAQVEVGVGALPHLVDDVGHAADAAQPERRGSTTMRAWRAAPSAVSVVPPSDGGQSRRMAS